MQKNQNELFVTKLQKKNEMEIFAFCVITFKIQTRLAPQNDSLNLSFVTDENTVGEKTARNGPKRPFIMFISIQSLVY